MSDEELLQRLHRTWVQALIHDSRNDCAAIIVDAELKFGYGHYDWGTQIDAILVFLPFFSYNKLNEDEYDDIKKSLTNYFLAIADGHIPDWDNSYWFSQNFQVNFRLKLLEIEEDWKNILKNLINQSKELNQGLVTEKVFARKGQDILTYNEMKFGSQSEIRIAQELERKKVLFFPLPLAVRNETGQCYKDHREVDFLVCVDGAFGILEVAYHPDRYEQDQEKDVWLKKSGILCIQHYTAEKCYNQSSTVVDEFLSILARHKR